MAKIYDIKSHRKNKSINKTKKRIINLVDLIADYYLDNPIRIISLVVMLISVIFLAFELGILNTLMIIMLSFAIVVFCFDIFME